MRIKVGNPTKRSLSSPPILIHVDHNAKLVILVPSIDRDSKVSRRKYFPPYF